MAQYKSRDSQNPYRTGVLVGNYVEDNFGVFMDFQAALRELCAGEHSGSFLADDAGALDDLLDAFLEKARRS